MATIHYERLQGKLNILADAAKYDVSCSSSGSTRKNQGGSLSHDEKSGICRSPIGNIKAKTKCCQMLSIYKDEVSKHHGMGAFAAPLSLRLSFHHF